MVGTERANVADLVRAAAARRPNGTALVHVPTAGDRTTTTWAALDADVEATAAGLRSELGLHTGERVALALGSTPAFVTAYFGALRAGLVAVPLNTGYTAPEVSQLVHDADAHVVLCDDATLTVVEEAVAGTHRALVDPAGLDSVTAAGRGHAADTDGRSGEDVAVLMFTSGTSGRPRAAMLSHRALLANLDQCRRLEPAPMTEDDVVLLVLPLFHIYGLNTGLGMVAATAATGVLVERFDPVATAELVRSEQVTNVPGAPPMYVGWSAAGQLDALRGVRLMASGASPLPAAVLEQVLTGVGRPVHEGYGLTETAPVVSSTLASDVVKAGSIGRPVPGVEVRLVDEDGNDVGDGDPGEVLVRGANLFSGYWPDGSGGPRDDGWWATGDVAYHDDDGDLFLVDRRTELVLVSGFNVYPREVEDALAGHPDVAEVAVIAVPHPYTGEAVKAFVVPRAGSSLTADDVTRHAATRLARFKRPTIVTLVPELPHSATGKVAKARLRAREVEELG
ncbi:MAG: AMP-binding protein [Sporichthyaceae bacterium]